MNNRKALVLNPRDNVATALTQIQGNTRVDVEVGQETQTVLIKGLIPFGHKFALRTIRTGGTVIKYGEVIGIATTTIEQGEYVHIHNVASTRAKREKT